MSKTIEILKNIHDGFDEKGDPVFYKRGELIEADDAFLARWAKEEAFKPVEVKSVKPLKTVKTNKEDSEKKK